MLIHRVIFVLLSWTCVIAIEDVKSRPNDIFDQVAIASENVGSSSKHPEIVSVQSKFDSVSPIPEIVKASTIHYENSNGFIPITSMDGSQIAGSDDRETNVTANDDDSSFMDLGIHGEAPEASEDDPAYSTEARMFLNLPGPGTNRRSFDSQDGQNEFEILKVTNETPAIANYHEFYENMRNNMNRNRGNQQGRYTGNEKLSTGKTIVQNQRTKDRIKTIDKYLTNYHGDDERDGSGTYKQYYSYDNANNKPANIYNQDTFEPEKVQSNFHQQAGSSIYEAYGDSPGSRPRTSSTLGINFDDGGMGSRHSQKSTSHSISNNRHVNSKPVVVVEPSDYKLDLKYGSQQVAAKVSNVDGHGSSKPRKGAMVIHAGGRYNGESPVNSEDRYGHSYERIEDNGDYSDEENDYTEITEKPRRVHKTRRRPYGLENSKRLIKEHRGHSTNDPDSNDSRKHNSPSRAKLHRPKTKPSYWNDDDRRPTSDDNTEDSFDNGTPETPQKSETKNAKHQRSRDKGQVTQWSQAGPNIEVSHSDGYQIDHMDKTNLLVPVNLNLVPLRNFDHTTALGNSQGFDFTNIPNFVTATPIASTPATSMSTSRSIVSGHIANTANAVKNIPNTIGNNYGISNAVPDIIVGQNTYQNPVQAVLLPQMNVHNKLQPTMRPQYLPSTVSPMFAVTQTMTPNTHNINPTMQSISLQNIQSNVTPRTIVSNNQNLHQLTMSPVSTTASLQPQMLVPQSTLQSFPLVQTPYHGNSNYNILVNPNGLHGQNVVQQGNSNIQGSTTPGPQPSSTTSQANALSNINLHTAESQLKKNGVTNANGQYLASASFAVGNGQQNYQENGITNNNKFFLPTNNGNAGNFDNNNNYYNGNFNNQQMRPQQNENSYQIYRDDQNNQKIKTYVQTAQILPGFIQPVQNIPVSLNNQNYGNYGGQFQDQSNMLSPNIVAQRPRDQNQQILKAANDIFENTWKQLQQLQTNDEASKNNPQQHIYRVNDNLGSTSNNNPNIGNHFQSTNSAKAHLPVLGTQNVEILNPNIKPSPVDMTFINPYQTLHHYPAAVLTTPIPIFSTTASFVTPRPMVSSTTAQSITLQNYVDSLTQMGAHSNQVNKLESAQSGSRNPDYQRPIFNPINFVPNLDLMKSQSILNSKLAEPLPNQLNLVPVIPGGNFFRNTYGAQTELVQKPRLSSDLEKYAEEMLRESMKTIYNTHKWNNDRRVRGNYSAADFNELAKLKNEFQRFKASLTDANRPGKDILEGHHSETKFRTAEPSRTTKRPELSIAAIEQLFKTDFKHKTPSSSDSPQNSNLKKKPNDSDEFRNLLQLNDYLTPPKPNSFVSKSPFVDSSKPVKKRPGSSSSRYGPNKNGARPLARPNSRPPSGPETSSSNHLESGIRPDGSRYEKFSHRPGKYSRENDHYAADYRRDQGFDSYPTFTTTTSPDDDSFKSSSNDQSTKTDYYDINHPRMHNLLGLLMKNKQLPTGSSQSFFRDDDELHQYFDNEKRRLHSQFMDETMMNFQKKADRFPIDMRPPEVPEVAHIRYYPVGKAP